MKKNFLLSLLLLAIVTMANAQHFGLQAGGKITNMGITQDNDTLISIAETKIKPGFMVGITLDLPLNNSMVINTALNFTTAGTWQHYGKDINAVQLGYINLDVTYEYIFNIGDLEIFAEGGGYLGYAVLGKNVYKPETGDKVDTDIEFGSEVNELKPIDAGFVIGAGIYFGNIKLSADYQHGLVNMSNDETDNERIKNRGGALKFTYFFNRK